MRLLRLAPLTIVSGCLILHPMGDFVGDEGAAPLEDGGPSGAPPGEEGGSPAPEEDAGAQDDAGDAQAPASSRYRAAVLADDPILYLRLGEASGTTAREEIAATHGTYSLGGLAYAAEGALAGDPDTAMTFTDGLGSLRIPGAAAEFDALAPFAIELWLKPAEGNSSLGFVVDHQTYAGGRNGWLLRAGANGLALERWNDNASNAIGAPALTVGTWHHVVAMFDGSRQYLYVDGSLAASGDTAQTLPSRGSFFSVGNQNCSCGSTNAFRGTVDELAIYAKPLTQQRILAHLAAAR